MESILSWIGGKSQSCKEIVKLFPQHHCYCETFGGALWVFFSKPRSKVEVLNDVNSNLIGFWRIIQRQPEEFIKREKYEMYSRELFNEYYADWYSGHHAKLTELEKAFRFFVMIRHAFSSQFGAGFGFGCSKSNAQAVHNEFKTIDKISERLKGVQIMNDDFQFMLEHFDSKDTLFYADPPYILAPVDNYYSKSTDAKPFTLHDHQRLYNTLTNIKGKFILTIDDCSFIRERYIDGQEELGKNRKFWYINNEVFYCCTSGDSRRHVNELIIANFDIIAQKKKNINNTGSKSLLEY